MKKSFLRKIFTFISVFSIVAQSLTPYAVLLPQQASAQEIVEPTPTETQTTVEPTTPQETPTPTSPQDQITPTETITPTPTEDPALITPTPTEAVTPTDAQQVDNNSPPSENQNSTDNLNSSSDNPTTPTVTPEVTVTPTPLPETGNEELNLIILDNVSAPSIDLDAVESQGSAVLTTDKPDYAPTDTALITGSSLNPNTTYTLRVWSEDEPPTEKIEDVQSDENGVFAYAYQLDGTYRPNYSAELKDLGGNVVASITFTDAEGGTATLPFSDSFGNNDINNVTGWQDNDGNGSGTRIEGTTSSRPGSSTTGHARVGSNGWICRTINASGAQSLQLSYYWRGDSNAENDDDGFVETKVGGNCTDSSGWTNIDSHDLNSQTSNWSNQQIHSLPSSINNQTFLLRFRSDADQNEGEFRIDDVSITASAIQHIQVSFCHAIPADTAAQGYNYLTTDDDSIFQTGHASEHDADIIPPFNYYGGSFPGKNWTPTGQAIYNNGCVNPNPDLTVVKTNNVNGNVNPGSSFIWSLTVANTGSTSATFNNKDILEDDLPSGASYSNLNISSSGVTGTIDCDLTTISGNTTLDCDDDPSGLPVVISAGGSFTVSFTVTPNSSGTLSNPRSGGGNVCKVDPDNQIDEVNNNNNNCSDSVIVAQLKPDLIISKSNNVSGSVRFGNTFIWTITVTNSGEANAIFNNNEDILIDNLPSNATYSPENNLPVSTSGGITGTIDCDIDNSSENLFCDANGTVTMPAGSSFSVSFTVTPSEIGTYDNPRNNGHCKVDPNDNINETTGTNNNCSDVVTVTRDITQNPRLPESCGLDIAFVIDNSDSISSSELGQMKNAFIGFIDALTGTPTEYSVTKFGTTASVVQIFTNNTTAATSAVNGISTGGGFTNWQDGLTKTQGTFDPRSNPNLVIFASDGNPNRTGNPASAVSESQAVNTAVIVANNIKSSGTRIVALGIGNNLDVDNLKAISGPTVGTTVSSDVITSSFDTLAADLVTYANELCGGTITVNKQVDTNGDGIYEGGNSEANTIGFDWGLDQELPNRDMGTNVSNIVSGDHSITENTVPGYEFTGWYLVNSDYSCNNPQGTTLPVNLNVNDESISSITLCNAVNNGDVEVFKYFDRDKDGEKDQDEEYLPDWTINLGQNSLVTDTNGKVKFENIQSGQYILSENIQEGWEQTNISCTSDSREIYLNQLSPLLIDNVDKDNAHEVNVTPNNTTICEIGNYTKPILTISKTNNTGGVDQGPGDSVLFTLTITATQSAAKNVIVKDLLPQGFTYNPNSWTFASNLNPGLDVSEPTYASPGTWNLGDMQVGETITLTYTAKIAGDQQTGTYKDLAWAQGNAINGDFVLALAEPTGYVDVNFVGTDVNLVNSDLAKVDYKATTTQEVLGASTSVLPATGENTLFVIIATLLMGLGFGTALVGIKLRRKYE